MARRAFIRTAMALSALTVLLSACASPARSSHVPAARQLTSANLSSTQVPVSTTTTAAPVPPPPCAPVVRACVSLSTKRAWLLTGGVIDYGPVPISHGAPQSPTPTGTFPVSWKDADNTSSIYGTPMPNSVIFAPGGIAFHEGSVTEDSHGCVRLAAAAAKIFFDALAPGHLVEVVP